MALLVTNENEFNKHLREYHYSIQDERGNLMAWEVPKLWELTKGFQHKKVELQTYQDLITKWMNFGGKKNDRGQMIVPFDVSHFERIRNARLEFPILVINDKTIHRNYRVADGMHRLMKCYLANIPNILIVEITKMPEPDMVCKK